MDLRTYTQTLGKGGSKRLAEALGISKSYLSQLVTGKAPISPARAVQIEQVTLGMVSRREIYKDWRKVWPELELVA